MKQTVHALEPYKNRLGMSIFVQSVTLYSWKVVLENLMWSLNSPYKIVAVFLYEPCISHGMILLIHWIGQ